MELPSAFVERMQQMLGEEYQEFIKSYDRERTQGLRLNLLKTEKERCLLYTSAIDCAVRYLMRRDGFEFRYGFRDQEEYEEYHTLYDEVYSQEKDALYTGGYNLYTSLDPEKQQILQEAVDEVLSFDEKTAENGIYLLQGAATVIDNKTGRVAAIVGGRSQETDTYTLNLSLIHILPSVISVRFR